jgi:hypothetical protein
MISSTVLLPTVSILKNSSRLGANASYFAVLEQHGLRDLFERLFQFCHPLLLGVLAVGIFSLVRNHRLKDIWKNGEKIDETYPAPDKDTDSVHRNNGQFFFTANHQGRTYAVRNKEIDKYSWYFFAIRWVDNDVYSISCDGNLFYLYQNHRPLYMLPLEDAGHWKLDLNSVCLTSN